MDLLDLMLDHDHWATRELLDASGGMTDAQLDQQFDIGLGTLRETFRHMVFNASFWTAFISGQPVDGSASTDLQPDDRSIAALADHHGRTYGEFAGVARRMRDEGRLGEAYTDHYKVRKSVGGTILVVIEHNAEHRTEALHILTRLGVPDLPEVDLGVWDYMLHNS